MRLRLATLATLPVIALACGLALPSAQGANVFPDDCLPPSGGGFVAMAPVSAGGGLVCVERLALSDFTSCVSPPKRLGASVDVRFEALATGMAAIGGGDPVPFAGFAQATMRVTFSTRNGKSRGYDLQLLDLNLAMGDGMLLRKSPQYPAYGAATATHAAGGDFAVDSFFDVFLEVSLDGGETWMPGQDGFANLARNRFVLLGP